MDEVVEDMEIGLSGTGLAAVPFNPRHVLNGHVLNGQILTSDPAAYGWPTTLAIEIAMRAQPVKDICESYAIKRHEWDAIRLNPIFVSEVTTAAELLRKDGAAFRVRAQLQSLGLLKESWRLIHDPACPYAVRADLIKFTVKVAGLDASKDQGALGKTGGGIGGLAINIHLG